MSEAQRWAEGFGISIPAYLKCRHRGVSESQVLEGLELAYERRHEHPMRTYKDVVGWAYAYARELEGNKLSTAQETVKEIETDYSNFKKSRLEDIKAAKTHFDKRINKILTGIKDLLDGNIKVKFGQLKDKLSAKEAEIDKLLELKEYIHNFDDRFKRLKSNELKVCKQLDIADSQIDHIIDEAKGHMSVIKKIENDINAFFKRGEIITKHLNNLDKKYIEIESKINLFAKNYADFQDNIDKLEKKLQKKVWVNRLMTAYGALATLFIGFLTYYLLWFPKG